MLTPRNYLSFSQMTLFEMSPEKYLEKYVYGKRERISRNMSYGSQMAKGLEAEEATGDPLLDLVMARLPKFELMDKPIEAILPVRGGLTACINAAESETTSGKEPEVIHLLAKPDTAKADYTAFKEYKTSVRKWTQKMADDSGQITFYATTIWLAKGFIPQDIEQEPVGGHLELMALAVDLKGNGLFHDHRWPRKLLRGRVIRPRPMD